MRRRASISRDAHPQQGAQRIRTTWPSSLLYINTTSRSVFFHITVQLDKHHPIACTTGLVAKEKRQISCTAVAGIVILMLDSKMEPAVAKNMVKGAPDTLHSEFRLGYSMLLTMMRGEGRMDARDLLAASYKQFQVERGLPALRQKIQDLQVRHPPSDLRQASVPGSSRCSDTRRAISL